MTTARIAPRSPLQVRGVKVPQELEVKQADSTVWTEKAVIGVRIAGNEVLGPDETKEEAQDDLADAVALCLLEPCDLIEPQPIDVLGDEDALRREICVYARDVHVRVPAEEPREAALVLRLDLVVELIRDPLAHLAQHRACIRAGRQALENRRQRAR